MNLSFNAKLAENYSSSSQKIRVLTEDWVDRQIYCPNCGKSTIDSYENNRPVADFHCPNCREEYELKSKKDSMGNKIVDGAYSKMIERLSDFDNPNFFFLNYNLQSYKVENFVVIPKYFFVPEIIEKRKPLSKHARRAGWIGCNILLQNIPQSGKIFYVKNGIFENKKDVLKNWQRTLFLREENEINAKGWLLDIMGCIEKIKKQKFSLNEVYAFEKELKIKHPDNNFVKDKIRQKLQVLRDNGYIEFISPGKYKLVI